MVDVVSDQTEISYAESTTNWSGDSFALENEILVQGSNSVAVIQTASGVNDVIYSGSWNMANTHVRVYINSNISANMALESAGGLEVRLGDGTNTAVWTVGGKDTYAGGWKDFFVDVESTPTSGSVNTASVTSVTFRINTVSKPRNATNGWYDNWRFGNGLEINSTTTEAINFADVATEDALTANQYDIIQDTDGVLFAKGKLTLGNSAGSKNCNLVSLNETIFFVDEVVSSTLYGIVGTEGTGATDIGITGLVCKTVGTSGAELDFSATVTSFVMDGCTFINTGSATFNTGTVDNTKFNGCGTTSIATGQIFTKDTWIDSDQITLNTTATIDQCTVDGTSATSAVLCTTTSGITDCTFTFGTAGHAVECTTAGTYSWSGNKDTGYTGTRGTNLVASTGSTDAMFYNNSGGLITLNVANGADSPSVRNAAGSTTQVNATFTLTMTDLIETTRVVIVNSITRVVLSDQVVSATGTLTYNHSGGEEVDIMPTHFDYKIDASSIYDLTLDNANQSIKFAQSDDLFSLNPI